MNKFTSAKTLTKVFALVIFLIVGNILYTGITGRHLISGSNVASFAKSRGKEETVEYATRGQIYTSDNEAVATNIQKYKLIGIVSDARPGYGENEAYISDISKTAEEIGPIIGMDPTVLKEKLQSAKDAGSYQVEFGTYGSNLSATQKKQIEDTKLPGFEFEENNSRNYPMGDFCSYIIGYAKSVDTDGVKDLVGQMGLEANYNKELAGENGYSIYEKDASGYVLPNGVLEQEDAVDGQDIYLTINSTLQRELDYQMQTEAAAASASKASAVIMEAKTGKILALSNYPSFNPNERNITDYTNFFFDAAYECGSVFKPFVYASSMEAGLYNGTATYASGTYDYGASKPIRDSNEGRGYGTITFNEGFYRSSNVAICNILERGYTNRDLLLSKYEELGFFQSATVDGFKSASGTALYKTDSSRAAYLTTGFGQGSTVTALQLLRAYSVFANDGKTVEPYLVDRIVDKTTNKVTYSASTKYSEQIFSSQTVSQMRDLLKGVVSDSTGTAKGFALDNGVQIIGKTGTGQISLGAAGYSTENYTKAFAGLAPYEDPQIVVLITFQGPSGGTSAHQATVIKNVVPTALSIVSSYNTAADATQSAAVSEYTLDSYINQSASFVKAKLESKALHVQLVGEGGTVLEQYPAANSSVTANDRIFLKTESGEISVPDFTGWSRKDVQTFGSLSGVTINVESGTGLVKAQSVAPATIVHAGDAITIALEE